MIDLSPRPAGPRWATAGRHLRRADPVLRAIIDKVGPCTLAPRRDYFAALCHSIITQQISTSAARNIYGRFRGLFPRLRPAPASLSRMEQSALREAGLSRQKITYLRGIADAFASRSLPVRRWRNMPDEQVIDSLLHLKGVGRWTAEMFLIFVLNRPDLLPVDDLGLRKGMQRAYGWPEIPTADQIIAAAEPWRPYRSIATWYIWRNVPA